MKNTNKYIAFLAVILMVFGGFLATFKVAKADVGNDYPYTNYDSFDGGGSSYPYTNYDSFDQGNSYPYTNYDSFDNGQSYYPTQDVYNNCDSCDYQSGNYPTEDVYNCDSCNTYGGYSGGSFSGGLSYGCNSCFYGGGYNYPTSHGCNSCSTPPVINNTPPAHNNNTNVNVNQANSSSTSSSTANANNYINFNPIISNNNPVNVTVNVPRGENQTNNQNLTAYCTANPSNPVIGTNVTWQASASGGTGSYTYSWNGDVSGYGQTVSTTYYNAGTKNAYVIVNSNGQQVTANCSTNVQPNGGTISNTVVYQQPYQPTGTPSAGVFLNQIPATGITPGLKMALFVLGLTMWSAFGAYMILQKRKLAGSALAFAGINASRMDADEVDNSDVMTEPVMEDQNQDNIESNLSFRARENNVLISRDGLEAIINRSGTNAHAAETLLMNVISKVSRNEGNYATLNSEKINTILNA